MRALSWIVVLGCVLTGCPATPSGPASERGAPSGVDDAPAPASELNTPAPAVPLGRSPVFDPSAPPEGVRFCRAKECHTTDGRILTYKEVMAEMGAERMVGSLDVTKLPSAPADVASPPSDAVSSSSGLAWRVLRPGSGERRPGPASRVLVHYSGWTSAGEAFDSSVARGRPSAFPLNRVIPGWQEALQGMVAGERRRVWIPESLAYKGGGGGPAGVLVFDLELIKILTL